MMILLTLTMRAVIELGAAFWVGIHLWQHLSLYPAPTRHEEEHATNRQVQNRFELRIALPILLVLLLAHIALVVEKAVTLSSGNVALFWLVRVLILLLAVRLSLSQRWLRPVQKVSPRITSPLSWINLLLGLVLFVALALSNDTAAAPVTIITPAALAEFLYLLAAALWIGGMLSIVTCSLPISSVRSFAERVHSQVILLPSSFPWVVAGGVLMAMAEALAATAHVSGWEQLRTTLYGQVFIIGGVLLVTLLLAMALHLFPLRQNVEKAYAKYTYAIGRKLEAGQSATVLAHIVKRREARLAMQTHQLRMIFGLEAVLGVGVIICFSLLNIFASSLLPPPSTQQRSQPTVPFQSSMQTFDKKFEATLAITPNRFGPNVFSVRVVDAQTEAPITRVTTTLITKMGEMDMGTLTLYADGHGVFSTHADMAMSGDWQIIIQIITADTVLHEAYVTLFTPL
jgi:putative copper export protein